jgi:GT2 family glycosyltransferase
MSKKKSLVIIIVLYNSNLTDSLSYMTLKNTIEYLNSDYILILYNNSESIEIPTDENYIVINSISNDKLSGAYNYALSYAKDNEKEWILLLDQDTELTIDYFLKLNYFFNDCENFNDIVAVVPFLKTDSKISSPHIVKYLNCWREKIKRPGIQNGNVTAFNSLTLINVEFLDTIGGFSYKYPLDMLDHWYYFKIHKHHKKIYVLNTYINHHLSITNYENDISIKRHKDLLLAEKSFIKEIGQLHYFLYKIRLFFRMIKQYLFFKNKNYSKIILEILLSR